MSDTNKVIDRVNKVDWEEEPDEMLVEEDHTGVCSRCGPSGGFKEKKYPKQQKSPSCEWICANCGVCIRRWVWRQTVEMTLFPFDPENI